MVGSKTHINKQRVPKSVLTKNWQGNLNYIIPCSAMASLNAWRSGSVPEDRLSLPCSRGEWVRSTESREDGGCLTMEDACLFLAGGFLPHKKAKRSSLRMFRRFFFTQATMSLFLCCLPFWIPKSTQLWRESTPSRNWKYRKQQVNYVIHFIVFLMYVSVIHIKDEIFISCPKDCINVTLRWSKKYDTENFNISRFF